MTSKDCYEDRKLQEEANKKNADRDMSKDFKYLVRGQPWNGTMVKIRHRFSAGQETTATAMAPVANLKVERCYTNLGFQRMKSSELRI